MKRGMRWLALLLLLALSGCESMYYDMVMDKSDGKPDASVRDTDITTVQRYR